MNILKNNDISQLEAKLDYIFKDKELLDKAFTHSSTANLFGYESNERLEFFGDSILSFIVSEKLYLNYAKNEGELSSIRSSLVSAQNLSAIIDEMGVFEYYLANTQIVKMNMPINVKADLFESILGAIYLDGGLTKAKQFVNRYLDLSKNNLNAKKDKSVDSKTELQEYLQGKGITDFKYITLSQTGPAHQPIFEIALMVQGKEMSKASGQSKRIAEQECAKLALKKLK